MKVWLLLLVPLVVAQKESKFSCDKTVLGQRSCQERHHQACINLCVPPQVPQQFFPRPPANHQQFFLPPIHRRNKRQAEEETIAKPDAAEAVAAAARGAASPAPFFGAPGANQFWFPPQPNWAQQAGLVRQGAANAGQSFLGAQFGGAQFPGAQFGGAQFPGGQLGGQSFQPKLPAWAGQTFTLTQEAVNQALKNAGFEPNGQAHQIAQRLYPQSFDISALSAAAATNRASAGAAGGAKPAAGGAAAPAANTGAAAAGAAGAGNNPFNFQPGQFQWPSNFQFPAGAGQQLFGGNRQQFFGGQLPGQRFLGAQQQPWWAQQGAANIQGQNTQFPGQFQQLGLKQQRGVGEVSAGPVQFDTCTSLNLSPAKASCLPQARLHPPPFPCLQNPEYITCVKEELEKDEECSAIQDDAKVCAKNVCDCMTEFITQACPDSQIPDVCPNMELAEEVEAEEEVPKEEVVEEKPEEEQ